MKYIKRHKDLIIAGIILISYIFLLLNISYFAGVIKKVFAMLTPFLYGFILAYLLNPLMKFIETSKILHKIKKDKTKHIIAIAISYLVMLVVLTILLLFIIPEVWESINNIFKDMPNIVTSIETWVNEKVPKNINFFDSNFKISEFINNNINAIGNTILQNSSDYASKAINITKSITTTIINIFIGIIISLYMLIQKDTFIRQSKKVSYALIPTKEKADRIIQIFGQLNLKISKFLSAKLLDSLIIGIICYIGVLIIGTGHSLTIATIIGITNLIPYFGPFIGAIPCVLIILAVSPVKALIFCIFIIVLQQFDGQILGPKLMSNSIGLSAFWVIFAVVIMTGIFGFAGMLIGIPIFAVIYALVQEQINEKLQNKNLTFDDINENTEDKEDKK